MTSFVIVAVLTLAVPGDGDLTGKTVQQLLACSGDASKCSASDWDLAKELERRMDTADLLRLCRKTRSPQRRPVVFALYLAKRDLAVEKLMRRLTRDADEEVAYYALNYLAKTCDPAALRVLSSPPFRVRAACEQWATTVRLFGTCQYGKGGPFLVDSLGHACGNVVAAADASLRELYPDAPSKFPSILDEKTYFRERIRSQR